MENHHFQWENQHKWSFSIAMLNYQRVVHIWMFIPLKMLIGIDPYPYGEMALMEHLEVAPSVNLLVDQHFHSSMARKQRPIFRQVEKGESNIHSEV